MKRCIVFAISLVAWLSPIGCSSGGKLTNRMAENALIKWMPACNPKVTGIQELPQENVATVNVHFSNFSFTRNELVYKEERNGWYPEYVPKTYTGPGVANFTHYNDGRWVLTKVVTSQGAKSTHWDDLSVEAR